MSWRRKYGLTRPDLILAVVFILAALLSLCWSWSYVGGSGGVVEIRQNGELIGSYPLSEDREITVRGNGYANVVVIKEGEVYMEHATCPDQYCVLHAPISHLRETIVCLPARLVVEVTSGEESGLDAVSN